MLICPGDTRGYNYGMPCKPYYDDDEDHWFCSVCGGDWEVDSDSD